MLYLHLQLDKEPNGNPKGKMAFLVTRVDAEDSEMSSSEFYLADGIAQLKSILLEEYIGYNPSDTNADDQINWADAEFDNAWGSTILFEKLGNIK